MDTVFHPVTPDVAGKIMVLKEIVRVAEVDTPMTKAEMKARRTPDPGYVIEQRAPRNVRGGDAVEEGAANDSLGTNDLTN